MISLKRSKSKGWNIKIQRQMGSADLFDMIIGIFAINLEWVNSLITLGKQKSQELFSYSVQYTKYCSEVTFQEFSKTTIETTFWWKQKFLYKF